MSFSLKPLRGQTIEMTSIPASFVHSIKETVCHGEDLPGWMYEIATGDLFNMPFTHIYYGSDEVLRASSYVLTAAFEKAGSGYELHIGNGMFHCYPAIRVIPECRATLEDDTHVDGTTVHIVYALKMGPKYEKRYLRHFRNPDILRFDMQHEAWIFQKEWTQPILDAMAKCMK